MSSLPRDPLQELGQLTEAPLPSPALLLAQHPLGRPANSRTDIPLSLHSEEKWEFLRPVITDLYMKKQRPLESVMGIMLREHQFKAR